MSIKKILLLKEHHGAYALDISTPEQLIKAALSVVKGRFGKENAYYNPAMEKPSPPSRQITKEQYDAMPSGELKDAAKEILERYEHKVARYNEEMKEINLIKKCLATNDGKLAWKILLQRKSYEDEDFEIIEVHDVYYEEEK